MARCTILRGVPGSGKTYCRKFHEEDLEQIVTSCSADSYPGLYGPNNEFHPELLAKAHGWCLRRFTEWCYGGQGNCVVDNTNITIAEIAPYYALAQAYGHDVVIVTIRCEVMKAVGRNVHNVPAETIFRMFERMKEDEMRFPPWWQHTVVEND